jgi:hypothetical protein
LAVLHGIEQPPQCASVVWVLISQPSLASPLQLAQPVLQLDSTQLPVEQLVVAFGREHVVPHAPQLLLVVSEVSQPLVALPSQLPHPLLHVPRVQVPVEQLAEAFVRVQVVPQAPQLLLVVSEVSQPSLASPLQLPQPLLQLEIVQLPVEQLVEAFAAEQPTPQPPQLVLVFSGVSQPSLASPLQLAQPALQLAMTQLPLEQLVVALASAQLTPQPPQFEVVVSEVSHPLLGLLSQLPQPDEQPGTQAPDTHAVVPWALVHALVHDPQLVKELREASQPSFARPLQLAQPALQLEIAQVPVEQEPEAFASEHTAPQAPQFESEVSAVSQPLAPLPSQLPQPVTQLGVHTPDMQLVVPCAFEHVTPQPPQLLTELRGVSQPLALWPSQLPQPALQPASWQVPDEHVVVALGSEQLTPQAPQFEVLLSEASQPLALCPSQLPKPVLHVEMAQAPELQLLLAFGNEQTVPHAPQWLVVLSCVSQPLVLCPSQLPQPLLQVPRVHTLLTQEAEAWAKEHTLVQLPQVCTLLVRLASQPLDTLPSQLPQPELHVIEQVPVEQEAVPLVEEHAWPQPPQFAVLVLVLTSQPLAACPSQLPQPVLHEVNVQVPVLQEEVALTWAQPLAQLPQSVRVLRLVSQPLAGLPSQLPQDAAQLGTHAPAVHEVVPLGLVQIWPQAPQLVLWLREVSQPLAALLSQLPQPVEHEMAHCPVEHEGVPLTPLQALGHEPQCAGSVIRLVSHPSEGVTLQLPKPALQVIEHCPAAQEGTPPADEHALEQVPQCSGLLVTLVSQPLSGLLSQLPSPIAHEIEHAPLLHEGVPVLDSHTLPQEPQLLTLFESGVSQPLSALPSQLP